MLSGQFFDRFITNLLFISKQSFYSTKCYKCAHLYKQQRNIFYTTNDYYYYYYLQLNSFTKSIFNNNYKKYEYLRTYSSFSSSTMIPPQSSSTTITTTIFDNQPNHLKTVIQEEGNRKNINNNNNNNINNGINDRRRDATTSIAMINYAKQGKADLCLQYYLKYLQSHGKLPSREALHQLTRVLYLNNHLSGLLTLHDTLLAYYKLHPPSRIQVNQLKYMYTMLINCLIRESSHYQPNSINNNNNNYQYGNKMIKRNKQYYNNNRHRSTSSPFKKDNTTTFKIIIKLCQGMQQFKINKPTVLYNTLIHWRVQQNDPELAWAIYQELKSHCSPTSYTYTTLLHLTRLQKDYDQMLQLLDDMERSEITPDRSMVSVITLALCDQHDYTNAKLFLDQLIYYAPHVLGTKYKSSLLTALYNHYQQQHSQQLLKNQNQHQQPQRHQQINNSIKLSSKEKRKKYYIGIIKKKQKRRKRLELKQKLLNNDNKG